jgi:hypothetical protein
MTRFHLRNVWRDHLGTGAYDYNRAYKLGSNKDLLILVYYSSLYLTGLVTGPQVPKEKGQTSFGALHNYHV